MLGIRRLRRSDDGVGSHHHTRTATVGIVVRLVVLVRGVIADVDHVDLKPPLFDGASHYAEVEDAEIFGKYGEKMKLHALYTAVLANILPSRVMTPFSVSISLTTSLSAGKLTLPDSVFTT